MKTYIFHIVIAIIGFGDSNLHSQESSIRIEDKFRIKEAIEINESLGDQIFQGMSSVPFVILLVSDGMEYLINHPYPTEDFMLLTDRDSILNCSIHFRSKVYPDHYLATFPAVNGVPTIVVGIPEKTQKTSFGWVLTLLHEHFHQVQMSDDSYYKEVDSLDLSGGDKSGMWMLNYPFPYDDEQVNDIISKFNQLMINGITANDNFVIEDLLLSIQEIKDALSENDFKYFSFQIWQEGIARYLEFAFLELLVKNRYSSESLQNENFSSLPTFHEQWKTEAIGRLATVNLKEDGRLTFYEIGWGIGLLLDKINSNWKNKYLSEKFYFEEYFISDL